MCSTEIHWQRLGVFASVSVAYNCFSAEILSYSGFRYITCRLFRKFLVLRAEQLYEPWLC